MKLKIIGVIILACLITALAIWISGKIFSTKPAKHEADWDFYLCNVNDKIASIIVDLGLHNIAPLTDKPNLVWISLKMNNPREDGLSSDEESKALAAVEDALVEKVASKHNAIYVGRITSAGYRDLFIYFGDTTNYDQTILEVMTAFPTYRFDCGAKEDKAWNNYFDLLYPTPEQFQCMQNRRVVYQLEQSGDDLTKAREVDHWIYFKTATDREAFLQKISGNGFTIVDKDYINDLDERPYRLHIKRIDKVDQESVDEYVIYLWKIANATHGDYDGWETAVKKD